MSGTPSKITGESAKIAAGINATALFFAPLIVTSPAKGRFPLITIFFHLFPPCLLIFFHGYACI
ncbi:hypothetical protein ACWPXQ_15425, partial [Enterococcus faecium]